MAPGERYLVAAGDNGAIRTFSLPGLAVNVARQKAHNGAVSVVVFSPDGRLLACGSKDRTVSLWDARTLQRLFTFPPLNSPVFNVAFSRDGALLGMCGADELITVWDLAAIRPQLAGFELDWDTPVDARSDLPPTDNEAFRK